MKLDLDYFKELAIENGGECLSKEYLNCRKKLQFRCSEGHDFFAQPRKVREGMWCKECSRNRNRKYNIDEDFFKKDIPESFYIAGFIAADGWVGNTKNGYVLGIELSIKDIGHLKNINSVMCSNYPIKMLVKSNESLRAISPNVKDFSEICSLKISNREIVLGLERFGIFPAKTSTFDLPQWLKKHELVNHFIRGFFDGDGSFCENKVGNYNIRFNLTGNVQSLKSVHEVICENNILNEKYDRQNLKGTFGSNKKYTKLHYGGNSVISRLYDFLYKDSTICLERKRTIAAKAKEYAVYGTDKKKKKKKKKKPKSTNLFTKEELLEKARELQDRKKIAEYFGCSNANISWWIKELDIKDEFNKALGKKTNQEIINIYNEIGTYSGTAKIVGLSKQRVAQIVKVS